MRFLVAPSGFKESLDACAVADAIAAGIHRVVPGAVVDKVPLVDGGEGSAKALAEATGGTLIPALVTGPIGAPVPSHFALLGGPGPRTAVVEMAAAAGLRLVPKGHRDPASTTTYGVGELIKAALDLPMDYPRSMESPEMVALRAKLWSEIREESLRAMR